MRLGENAVHESEMFSTPPDWFLVCVACMRFAPAACLLVDCIRRMIMLEWTLLKICWPSHHLICWPKHHRLQAAMTTVTDAQWLHQNARRPCGELAGQHEATVAVSCLLNVQPGEIWARSKFASQCTSETPPPWLCSAEQCCACKSLFIAADAR